MRTIRYIEKIGKFPDLVKRGAVGECSGKGDSWLMRVDSRQDPMERITTRVHEYAHVVIFTEFENIDHDRAELAAQEVEVAMRRAMIKYLGLK